LYSDHAPEANGAGCQVRGMALWEPLHPAQDSHRREVRAETEETPRAWASPPSPNTRNLTEGGDADVQEESQADRHSSRAGGGAGDGVGHAGSDAAVFDMDNAKFYSDNRVAFAYIPLHPASRSLKLLEERLEDLFAVRAVNVEISALYLPEDVPGFLKAGTYKMKLVDRTRLVLVDQEGQEVFSGKVEEVKDTRGQSGHFVPWQITISNPKITIQLHFFCSVTITIIIEW
jgi:hypothetical protein